MINNNSINIPNTLTKLKSTTKNLSNYLDELESVYNKFEPDISAFIPEKNRFTRLRQEIAQLELVFSNSIKQLPLSGLPIGVKDIFHVNNLKTFAGSKLPPEKLSGPEAKCVTALKELGAFVFGKTVTTEFAYFGPGPTKNPYNLKHTPGGSSSGSAAAVAVGMVPFAFGTQTIGSIIRPVSYCGVVGFKPTYGRIPTEGVIPVAPSVDTIGFFTANPISAQFMSQFLLCDWDPNKIEQRKPTLGIPLGPYIEKASSEMINHFKSTSHKLEDAGYRIVEGKALTDFEKIYEDHNKIVAYEAAQVHQEWYQEFKHLYHPKTVELIVKGQRISYTEYQAALSRQDKFRYELKQIGEQKGIDVWISPPAQGPAPKGLESTGNPIMNLPWTYGGYPTINLPAGFNKSGLPMGLQLSAELNMDENLLYWAVNIKKIL